MKKLLLPILLFCGVQTLHAQLSIDAQVKYAYNSSALFNKNISDLGASQDYDFAFNSNYGAAVNVNYAKIGIGAELLLGSLRGAYQGTIVSANSSYTSEVNLDLTQIPVYLRVGGAKGSFGEFGVVLHNVKNATYSATNDVNLSNYSFDATSRYQSFMGYMVGVGGRMSLPKIPVILSISARFMYSTADAKGVDALGLPLDGYPTYYNTNAASVGLHAGLVYSFEQ